MQNTLKSYIKNTLHTHVKVLPQKDNPSFWVKSERIHDFERAQLHLNDRHFLMTDYDHSYNFAQLLYDINPNFIIYNPIKNTHQAFWLLNTPVHCQNKYSRPYRYLRAIENAYDTKYNCDSGFNRDIHRNPLYPQSDVDWIHNKGYELSQLASVVNLNNKEISEVEQIQIKANESRNKALFDELRHIAYAIVRKHPNRDYNQLESQLDIRSKRLNTSFKDNSKGEMSSSELRSIVRSISRFCINVYDQESGCTNITDAFRAKQAKRGSKGGKKSKGGGRPSIDKKLIEEILVLRKVHKYSIRKIANELKISKSVVSKYAQ